MKMMTRCLLGVTGTVGISLISLMGYHFYLQAFSPPLAAPTGTPLFLEGLWSSYPTGSAPSNVVEEFSLEQGPPSKGGSMPVAIFGSVSSLNKFTLTGNMLEGPVSGTINDDGTEITWSHGYTSSLVSSTPIDLNGLWLTYAVSSEDKKGCKGARYQDSCSVAHRGTDVKSFCSKSLLHQCTLSDSQPPLMQLQCYDEENKPINGAVLNSGAIYFPEKGLLVVRPQYAKGGPSREGHSPHHDEQHEHDHYHEEEDDFNDIDAEDALLGFVGGGLMWLVALRVFKPDLFQRCVLGVVPSAPVSVTVVGASRVPLEDPTPASPSLDNHKPPVPVLTGSSAYPGLV